MSPSLSPPILTDSGNWHVAGKGFRDCQQRKITLSGVTYGPFKPNAQGEPWPEAEQLRRDIAHIASLGFNTVRIYEPPTEALLSACRKHQLKLLAGIPWSQHVDFMAQSFIREDAEDRVRTMVRRLSHEPCVFAFIVGNEIEKTLVRWMQPDRVRYFIEELIAIAKEEAPEKFVAYASYPSTEYLVPRNADFIACNVFLEDRERFAAYVQRLQNLAANKPLVISEFGLDVQKHGEIAQAATRQWQLEVCRQKGVAGSFWFSYTDEWARGGEEITQWSFGLVSRDRQPRPACGVANLTDRTITSTPRFSVIVCSRNGSSTLRSCLEALGRQTYPHHEVLLIDDGSTDDTPEIARSFNFVQYHRQEHAGLSAARNHGMRLAAGELLAYTDDDCIPDEDWLQYLSAAFDTPEWVAAGGPNISPPPRNETEACVAAAPGAPSHVLLNDEEAEHLPGCNLVIRKDALLAIGGFRMEFTTAGDDVDICWRLRNHGGKLRFVPAAVVWHHRRFTVQAYLRQQSGYGHAEAMLMAHYPERFAWFSGAHWRGTIYGDEGQLRSLDDQTIHFGAYGLAPFQCIYASSDSSPWQRFTGLPWFIFALIALIPGLFFWPWLGIAGLIMGLSWVTPLQRASSRDFMFSHPTWNQKVLLFFLCYTQPIVREWARLRGMMLLQAWPGGPYSWSWPKLTPSPCKPNPRWSQEVFWSEQGINRDTLLPIMKQLAPAHGLQWLETGEHSLCDAELITHQGDRHGLIGVTEYHGGAKCLTRFAFGPAPKYEYNWLALLSLFSGALLFYLDNLHSLGSTLMLFGLIACTILFAKNVKAKYQIRSLLKASAMLAGMIQDPTGLQISAETQPSTATSLNKS
ncbi:hypothetical protein BH11VER1_BH11VER1_29180 [soil metagenome]